MEVRLARPGDERDIADVHVRTWQICYRGQLPDAFLDGLSIDARTDGWRRILAAAAPPADCVIAAEHDARIVGFAHVCPSRDGDAQPATGEVTSIYLLPELWGRGCGRALLERAVKQLVAARCTAATLWVLDSNVRARRFYEAAGWIGDGAVKVDDRGAVVLREVRYRLDPDS